jgi:hypothetical protein
VIGGASGSNEVKIFEKRNNGYRYEAGISGFTKGFIT